MRFLLAGLVLASSLGLGGCAQVFGSTENMKVFLSDLQTCDRDYTVAMGTGGAGLSGPSFNGSAHISCKAQKAVAGGVSAPLAPAVSSPPPATVAPPA